MHGRMHTKTMLALASALTPAVAVLLGAGPAGAARLSLAAKAADHATGRLTHTNNAGNPFFGFPEAWGLSHHDVLLIGAGFLIALLLVVILGLRVRRRRRAEYVRVKDFAPRVFPQSAESWRGTGMVEEPTGPLPKFRPSEVVLPGPERGWHPVEGDQARIAYWDGTRWAAFRQWDGQDWVEPTTAGV